jgi:hypothetical protein
MNRIRTLAVAAAVPLASFALAARSAAVAPTAQPPSADQRGSLLGTVGEFPVSGEVPADWTRLVDDTGTISIAVPGTWTLVDTAPVENGDGTAQPWISATTDMFVPRVIYRAYPPGKTSPELLEWSRFDGLCAPGQLQPYNDRDFVGYVQSFDACDGAGASRIVEVMAIPQDRSFTAYLVISLPGNADDEATLDGLLSSFSGASGSPASTTTADAATPPTTSVLDIKAG